MKRYEIPGFTPITSDGFARRSMKLFRNCRKHFGSPEARSRAEQLEYVDLFASLVCEYLGHDVIPDQCGIPEHDYCTMCHERIGELRMRHGEDDATTSIKEN